MKTYTPTMDPHKRWFQYHWRHRTSGNTGIGWQSAPDGDAMRERLAAWNEDRDSWEYWIDPGEPHDGYPHKPKSVEPAKTHTLTLTKNDMARVIVQALERMPELPAEDHFKVKRMERRNRKDHLQRQHARAVRIIQAELERGTWPGTAAPVEESQTRTYTLTLTEDEMELLGFALNAARCEQSQKAKAWIDPELRQNCRDRAYRLGELRRMLDAAPEENSEDDGVIYAPDNSDLLDALVWTRKRFFEAAGRAGLEVETLREGVRRIKRGSVTVGIWPDGTCTRADVPLTLATKMTYRDAARALGLDG